jgi:hypothetical protein
MRKTGSFYGVQSGYEKPGKTTPCAVVPVLKGVDQSPTGGNVGKPLWSSANSIRLGHRRTPFSKEKR